MRFKVIDSFADTNKAIIGGKLRHAPRVREVYDPLLSIRRHESEDGSIFFFIQKHLEHFRFNPLASNVCVMEMTSYQLLVWKLSSTGRNIFLKQ